MYDSLDAIESGVATFDSYGETGLQRVRGSQRDRIEIVSDEK